MVKENNKGSNIEFILGLLGGIFGFFGGFAYLLLGVIGTALFGTIEGSTIIAQSVLAIIFAIIGIIGASIVKGNPKKGGWLMIISAIISLYYLLPFVLLIIAGIMSIRKK